MRSRPTAVTSLRRVTTTAQRGVTSSSGTLTASNLRVSSTGFGLVAEFNAAVTVNEGLFTMPTGTPGGNIALVSQGGATLNARSLTIIGTGTGAIGIDVLGSAGTQSHATVADSIFSGFTTDVRREVNGAVTASADLTLDHDIVNLGVDSGVPGIQPSAVTNVNLSPLFVDASHGDYRPKFNSPAVDSGGDCPALSICATTPDMAGRTRPINGVLDRGAFEYAHQAPTVSAVAGETIRFIGAASSFTASGADADADPLTYAWTFDDGGVATGAVVSHMFTTLGVHTAHVTATDATGLTATASATTNITVPPVLGPPVTAPPPSTPDKTPPVLSKLALSHPTFAVSSASNAVVAKAKAKKKKPVKGTTITFTLSELAGVTLKFELETPGVISGGKCVARSKAHAHGKKCTVFVRKVTLSRRNLPAGHVSIAFSGRIGTKPLGKGKYRLTASATDPAGNHSKTPAQVELQIV